MGYDLANTTSMEVSENFFLCSGWFFVIFILKKSDILQFNKITHGFCCPSYFFKEHCQTEEVAILWDIWDSRDSLRNFQNLGMRLQEFIKHCFTFYFFFFVYEANFSSSLLRFYFLPPPPLEYECQKDSFPCH